MSAGDRASNDDERFERLRLIPWWKQERLASAKVLVVGAGALGNEVIKNCALLGVGQLVVIDLDEIEPSNLSRSVLFRASDAGLPKAQVAARAARDLYPGMAVQPLVADINHDVGLGFFLWADVVLGALDNREARLTINRHCYRTGTPWIDGAIEQVSGVARLFLPPEGPCYECTMSETDWHMLAQRRSCSLLNRALIERGHVPTTPTTASIVAGVMCQEAVKLLHDQDGLRGSGWVFDGHAPDAYVTTYQRHPDCLSHEPLPAARVELPAASADVTLGGILAQARAELGDRAQLELVRELLRGLECPACEHTEPVFRPLSSLTEEDGRCGRCGARRTPHLFHAVDGQADDLLDLSLARAGLPLWDGLVARSGEREVAFVVEGDRAAVLGALEATA